MLSIVLYSREIQIAIFMLGQILDEALNLTLKSLIKEHRPDSHVIHSDGDYGMPSAHSQFSFFFATYFTLFIILK